MKTSKLTGAALDWAVTQCEGADFFALMDWDNDRLCYLTEWGEDFEPSTNWAQGGVIIERERICLEDAAGMYWVATMQYQNDDHDLIYQAEEQGTTPLIAAMRCYVASCLGDDVELPEELDIN